MERYGAPFAGGFMQWPLKWLRPVETAMNVYQTLTAVNSAMKRMEGEALTKWKTDNARSVRMAVDIERLRAAMDEDGGDVF